MSKRLKATLKSDSTNDSTCLFAISLLAVSSSSSLISPSSRLRRHRRQHHRVLLRCGHIAVAKPVFVDGVCPKYADKRFNSGISFKVSSASFCLRLWLASLRSVLQHSCRGDGASNQSEMRINLVGLRLPRQAVHCARELVQEAKEK